MSRYEMITNHFNLDEKCTSEKDVAHVEIVFCDGACSNNGKDNARAACGVYFGEGDERNMGELIEGELQTNNRAELTGVLRAVQRSRRPSVLVLSDSSYVVDIFKQGGYLGMWKRNSWKLKSGMPVKNQDLIRQIDECIGAKNVVIGYVEAHVGHVGNEMADKLATAKVKEVNILKRDAGAATKNKQDFE